MLRMWTSEGDFVGQDSQRFFPMRYALVDCQKEQRYPDFTYWSSHRTLTVRMRTPSLDAVSVNDSAVSRSPNMSSTSSPSTIRSTNDFASANPSSLELWMSLVTSTL